MTEEEIQQALQAYLRRTRGGTTDVVSLQRLAGGASCVVYGFDADLGDGAGRRSLVLRTDGAGATAGADRHQEYELVAAADRAGVRVPAVYAKGDDADGLPGRFFIMDRVPGQAMARRLLREARYATTRRALPAQLATELARIHRVDTSDPSLVFLHAEPCGDGPGAAARHQVRFHRELVQEAGADRSYPALALVARWLEAHAPECSAPALVHGDFRIGNVMFDDKGLTAILDWELAHLGDPAEDLGWFCVRAWRFGNDSHAAGGLCSRRQFLDLYQQAGGTRVDPAVLRYWEIYGNWKWAILCIVQCARHKAGARADVELAAIGRRVAETQWEMLALLEEAV